MLEHNINGKVIYSLYLHLAANSWRVNKGDPVDAGQIIATMGNTGLGTGLGDRGIHLHFAISDKNSFPILYNLTDYTLDKWYYVDYIVHPKDNAKYYNPEKVLETNGSIIK